MMTAIDEIANQNHLQMIKAAIPFLPGPGQRIIGVYIKMLELQNVMHFFRQAEPEMQACSVTGCSLPEMLEEIRAFGNASEQQWIDQCMNMITTLQLCNELSRPLEKENR